MQSQKFFYKRYDYEYCEYQFYFFHQYNYYDKEVYNIEKLLLGLRSSNFKFFFSNHTSPTPTKLNQVKSLRRLWGKSEFAQLTNFFVKKGKKLKTILTILSSYQSLLKSNYELNALQNSFS